MTTDVIQTIAIIATLLFTVWQSNESQKESRKTLKLDNFSKIISALNDIRHARLADPELERALFESRKDWNDAQIKRRVYGVMLANLMEWTMFSHESDLIDDKHWEDWLTTWKDVILSDNNFAELMSDQSIYTFNFRAYDLVLSLIEENKQKQTSLTSQ